MVELKSCEKGFRILSDGKDIGIIEYKNFWEGMPYLSLIKLLPEYRRKGFGSSAMRLLEHKLRGEGNVALLVSTRVDECAQHFYRRLGYRECGGLILENTPFQQPIEMFFIKEL